MARMTTVHGEKGFSLVEVLLGIAIFMIGMLGVAALQISSMTGNAFSGNLTEATYLMMNKVEELMNLKYDNALLTDPNANGAAGLDSQAVGTPAVDHEDPVGGRNNIFQVYWNVAENVPMPRCKTIKVFARWSIKGAPQPPINMQFVKEEIK